MDDKPSQTEDNKNKWNNEEEQAKTGGAAPAEGEAGPSASG